MLATSTNVLYPGHNHLLTTGIDDSTLIIGRPGNRTFLEVASMVVTWWMMAFLHSRQCSYIQKSAGNMHSSKPDFHDVLCGKYSAAPG